MEPVPNFDLYAELEVSRTATTPTIDAAWRSLLKRNHPDLGGPRAAERTVRLNIAHDWLTDPGRRARYDEARQQARRERAAASAAAASAAARERGGAAPDTFVETAPPRPAASRPAASRPVSSRPGLGSVLGGRAFGQRGDRWRTFLVVLAVVALVLGFRIIFAVTAPGAPSQAEASPSPQQATASQGALLPAASPTAGSTGADTPASTPRPSGAGAGSSPSVPALSLSGGGDHGATRLDLTGGTYQVDYVVSSPAGDSCPWALYLTDSTGLDLLMASAYPVNETVRDSKRDSGVVAGAANVRVESACPHWSASITRIGP